MRHGYLEVAHGRSLVQNSLIGFARLDDQWNGSNDAFLLQCVSVDM